MPRGACAGEPKCQEVIRKEKDGKATTFFFMVISHSICVYLFAGILLTSRLGMTLELGYISKFFENIEKKATTLSTFF